MIQQIYLDDTGTIPLFCLGIVKKNHWEPLRVQGKIGYAYQFEAYAQKICSYQSSMRFADNNMPLQELLPSAAAS